MTSPKERWTTLVALTCFVVFFLGHLGISLDNARDEGLQISRRKINENIIADQRGQKRSNTRDINDRFAEVEKRSDTYPFGVQVKRSGAPHFSDAVDHEPPSSESFF